MDQIKPPTDSLYKFIAIFGLIVFLGSYFVAYRNLDRAQAVWVAFYESVSDPDGAKYQKLEDYTNDETIAIDAYVRSLPKNERAGFVGLLHYKMETEHTLMNIQIVRWIGILMIILGFNLWYFRVQMYVDAILRREARDSR
ncbi:hypothetical protein [Rosistilla oblonga]|uniref:hypothetical protein n=1 Tax=Rosistilla oblonga TaxID=2527990 RepID=UPI003A978562